MGINNVMFLTEVATNFIPTPPPGYFTELPFAQCMNTFKGLHYNGTVHHTRHGIPCQAWASQSPHAHSVTADNITDANLAEANNYCRNAAVKNDADPTNVYKHSVWCYTTDNNTRWDYCDVPSCKSKNIY